MTVVTAVFSIIVAAAAVGTSWMRDRVSTNGEEHQRDTRPTREPHLLHGAIAWGSRKDRENEQRCR